MLSPLNPIESNGPLTDNKIFNGLNGLNFFCAHASSVYIKKTDLNILISTQCKCFIVRKSLKYLLTVIHPVTSLLYFQCLTSFRQQRQIKLTKQDSLVQILFKDNNFNMELKTMIEM